ncbi:MAG: hypothetical protein JW976_09730 [Syntrophaceae bacterium]|nr:hypothetical protein [Syntrophaceae bacterium]
MFNTGDPSVTPLMKAPLSVGMDETRRLIAQEPDLDRCDAFGNTALHHACSQKNLLKARLLIQTGASLVIRNAENYPALFYYEPLNDWSELKLMIDDAKGITREQVPGIVGDRKKVKLLQMYRAWLSRKEIIRGEELHRAIKKGHVDKVRKMLKEGQFIEIFDKRNNSPVFNAVLCPGADRAAAIIGMLKEAGADCEVCDYRRRTPIQEALWAARPEVVAALDPDWPLSEPLRRRIMYVDIVNNERYGVSFYPTNPWLTVSYFTWVPRGHEGGGEMSAREMLEKNRKFLETTGAGWFIPFLERYVQGEPVSVEELEDYSLTHFNTPLVLHFAAP